MQQRRYSAQKYQRTGHNLWYSTIITDINLPDGGWGAPEHCLTHNFMGHVDLNNVSKVPQIELFIFANWDIFKMALLSGHSMLATVSGHFLVIPTMINYVA